MTKLLTFASLAALAAALPAGAATVTSFYNTGVDDNHAVLVGNVEDSHWNVVNPNDPNWMPLPVGHPVYTGVTNGQFPSPPWIPDSSTSRWDTPTTSAGDYDHDHIVDGVYTYTTTFSLTGYQVGTAALSGEFASDNTVDAITLNGHVLAASGGSFTAYVPFSAPSGDFVAGTNTLTFTVRNFANGSGSNPTGLRVDATATAAVVPEPATWALFIGGFGAVGFATRRRARTVAA